MPCIETKVSISISPEQEAAIKTELGKAIRLIPGKSENWLMLTFEQNVSIYFQGDKESPAAFVAVSVYGKTEKPSFDRLTGEICRILQDNLGIASDRIYVKYEEVEHWGWNGSNF